MSRLSRTALLAAAGCLFFFSIGCMAMTVASHVDRLADFGLYRTWDWGPADALPTGDARLDNNPFLWAQNTMDDVIDNQDRMEKMINGATRMLKQLPRAL